MKIRIALATAAGAAAMLALSGCATMSEDQCLAGDWGGKGLEDGRHGYDMSRLEEHTKACAKFGVAAEPAVYYAAREQGLIDYCRPDTAFREGARGNTYRGVCPAEAEADFLPAYTDGRRLHAATEAADNARSNLNSLDGRIDSLEDKLRDKERELSQDGLTDDQRSQIRSRISEVRGELRDARRDRRRAEDDVRYAESEADRVRWDLTGRYGPLM